MKNGFAMLLSVLILGVIGVAISTTLITLSISASQTAGTLNESQRARAVVSTCIEKALQSLITSSAYSGSGSATLGGQTCTYSVTQINTSTDTIYATSTVGQTTRKLLVKLSTPNLTLLTWQEI